MSEGSLWSDQERARGVVEEVKSLKRWIEPYHALRRRVDDARELMALVAEEQSKDDALERQLEHEADEIGIQLDALELQSLMRRAG